MKNKNDKAGKVLTKRNQQILYVVTILMSALSIVDVVKIRQLEASKKSAATAAAITAGVAGTAFMAGSVFAVTAQPPNVILCIVLAVPGFLGWILPYFLYRKMKREKTEKITPLIESKYEQIYGICEKGNKLLH